MQVVGRAVAWGALRSTRRLPLCGRALRRSAHCDAPASADASIPHETLGSICEMISCIVLVGWCRCYHEEGSTRVRARGGSRVPKHLPLPRHQPCTAGSTPIVCRRYWVFKTCEHNTFGRFWGNGRRGAVPEQEGRGFGEHDQPGLWGLQPHSIGELPRGQQPPGGPPGCGVQRLHGRATAAQAVPADPFRGQVSRRGPRAPCPAPRPAACFPM